MLIGHRTISFLQGDTLRISLLIRYLGKFPLPQGSTAAVAAAAMSAAAAAAASTSSSQPSLHASQPAALAAAIPPPSSTSSGGAATASATAVSHGPGAKFLVRAQMTLHEVQCHLDIQGASKLIVDLVIKSANTPKIFSEAVELGSALLEGGNQEIQRSLFAQLHSGEVSQVQDSPRRPRRGVCIR